MTKSPSSLKDDILFTGSAPLAGLHSSWPDESGESESELDLNASGYYHEPLICLELLKTMIAASLHAESDRKLLTPKEVKVLLSFEGLSVQAQHLFVYLLIYPHWHRLGRLKLVDIPCGDVPSAIRELCHPVSSAAPVCKAEENVKAEPVPLNLSALKHEDSETKVFVKTEPCGIPGPSDVDTKPTVALQLFPTSASEADPASLCITESEMDLRQLVEYLDPEDLRDVAKELKIKLGKKKPELIEAILSNSKTQPAITTFFRKGKAEPSKVLDSQVRPMIMKKLYKLVRADPGVVDIFRRVHILYFRCTRYPTDILPRSLRHLRRQYPEYHLSRSSIWDNRVVFREYEDALMAEAILNGVPHSGIVPEPEPESPAAEKIKHKRTSGVLDNDDAAKAEAKALKKEANARAAARKAEATVALLEDVFSIWVKHLAMRMQELRLAGASERFEPGYVLTRAIWNGVKAFRVLKQPDRELDVLDELLAQTYWCIGLRGTWHVRKADLLTESAMDTKAIAACLDGLKDPDTALVSRPTLIKLLGKLQKRASTPPEDQINLAEPSKIPKIVFIATKIDEKKKTSNWKSRGGEEGPLAKLVSQHYEERFESVIPGGYILPTLFALLFWDILFTPVAGAFETCYQTSPLDLCEDTFLAARQDAIALRLSEIEAGRAMHYVEKHDREHRDAKQRVAGVRWDVCSSERLVHLSQCIPPKTLATICEMFCQDYAGACLGSPDLIAWDVDAADQDSYMLVHIKATGHASSRDQQAFRDVLARGGAAQEACEVGDGKKKADRKGKGKGKGKAADSDSEPDSDCESGSDRDDTGSEDADEEEGRTQRQSQKKRGRDADSDEEYRPKKRKKRMGV